MSTCVKMVGHHGNWEAAPVPFSGGCWEHGRFFPARDGWTGDIFGRKRWTGSGFQTVSQSLKVAQGTCGVRPCKPLDSVDEKRTHSVL